MEKQPQKTVICFRRWRRKSYAAFASIGKTVKIGVISVSCSLITMRAQPALAQSVPGVAAGDTLRELEEVVVAGERPPQFLSLMQVVSVLQRSDIERAPVNNLQDLLRYIDGVDLRTRGTQNVQADISLRGGTFDQTVIFLNGVNITDPQTGHYSLDIPINLEHIRRIEVLQGPGAWTSGAVAYSGAINIVTALPDTSGAALSLAQGAHDYQLYEATAHLRHQGLQAAVSAAKSTSDGFTDNTDFDITNVYAQLRYRTARSGVVSGQFGYQNKSYGANSFYSAAYPNQFDHVETCLSSLHYNVERTRWGAAATIYHRQHYDRYELFRNDPASYNYHRTDVAGALAQLNYLSKWGTTTGGVNYRYEHIYSNKLGEPMADAIAVKGEEGALYTHAKTRSHLAGFVQHTLRRQRLHVTAGLMGAGNNDFGFRLYAGANLSYDLAPHWQLRSAVSNSYRLPTFTDLYYTSPSQQGNPALKPEEAVSAEVSALYRPNRWRAMATVFYRYGYRTIDWTRAAGETVWVARNLTNVASAGANLLLEYAPQQHFLKKVAVAYAYLYVAPEEGNYASAYAVDHLRHRLSASLQHGIWRNLSASWQLSYQQREGHYLDAATDSEQFFPAFWLCDAKLFWQTSHYTLFVEATNLFNKRWFDFGNIPQPGRWLKAGVTVHF